jgi:nucleoside-diphosphate-sugar epimerase
LFCLARRSRQESGIMDYPDMRWTQVDVARWDSLREVIRCIKEHGGADYVLHLAGYYDFHNMDNPEYERTNVTGTRNVLKLARQLGVKRFIFASSLAACRFPDQGSIINEDSPADANFAYAASKLKGEQLILAESEWFPSAIVRMAAVYSDWCEYPPVYVMLRTWLSDAWNARILGGRGESAVPYIHIQDLLKLFHRIIECSELLPRTGVYNASPNTVATHRELYEAATRYFYGETPSPRCLPKWLCRPGVGARYWLGRMLGNPPHEAPWMVEYIDKQLRVDSNRTQAVLDWAPSSRLDINRRLLMLVENMKSHGEVWRQRNEEALRRVSYRPNLVIAYRLEELREVLVSRIIDEINDPRHGQLFKPYCEMKPEVLRWYIMFVYQVLINSARTTDKQLVRQYALVIAARRHRAGFALEQVQEVLTNAGRIIAEELQRCPDLADQNQHIYDHVSLSFQLACDGIADAYETMAEQAPEPTDGYKFELSANAGDMQSIVRQLEDVCGESMPDIRRIEV